MPGQDSCMAEKKKAVVLLSGGIDSTTTLAVSIHAGFEPYAMSFRYGQRHTIEVEAARTIVRSMRVRKHSIVDIDLRSIGGSALTGDIEVPKNQTGHPRGVSFEIPLLLLL